MAFLLEYGLAGTLAFLEGKEGLGMREGYSGGGVPVVKNSPSAVLREKLYPARLYIWFIQSLCVYRCLPALSPSMYTAQIQRACFSARRDFEYEDDASVTDTPPFLSLRRNAPQTVRYQGISIPALSPSTSRISHSDVVSAHDTAPMHVECFPAPHARRVVLKIHITERVDLHIAGVALLGANAYSHCHYTYAAFPADRQRPRAWDLVLRLLSPEIYLTPQEQGLCYIAEEKIGNRTTLLFYEDYSTVAREIQHFFSGVGTHRPGEKIAFGLLCMHGPATYEWMHPLPGFLVFGGLIDINVSHF
ncbi:hypothetical protein C8R44DRAFT_750288 [Mycena epipterygia]|nr:hypothetical protein C8R44DRAFT_750288 [Mycena epipterygia]